GRSNLHNKANARTMTTAASHPTQRCLRHSRLHRAPCSSQKAVRHRMQRASEGHAHWVQVGDGSTECARRSARADASESFTAKNWSSRVILNTSSRPRASPHTVTPPPRLFRTLCRRRRTFREPEPRQFFPRKE